jgi:hypothetical protein
MGMKNNVWGSSTIGHILTKTVNFFNIFSQKLKNRSSVSTDKIRPSCHF